MYGGIHFFSLSERLALFCYIYIYNDKSNNESKEREVMLLTHTLFRLGSGVGSIQSMIRESRRRVELDVEVDSDMIRFTQSSIVKEYKISESSTTSRLSVTT